MPIHRRLWKVDAAVVLAIAQGSTSDIQQLCGLLVDYSHRQLRAHGLLVEDVFPPVAQALRVSVARFRFIPLHLLLLFRSGNCCTVGCLRLGPAVLDYFFGYAVTGPVEALELRCAVGSSSDGKWTFPPVAEVVGVDESSVAVF